MEIVACPSITRAQLVNNFESGSCDGISYIYWTAGLEQLES